MHPTNLSFADSISASQAAWVGPTILCISSKCNRRLSSEININLLISKYRFCSNRLAVSSGTASDIGDFGRKTWGFESPAICLTVDDMNLL